MKHLCILAISIFSFCSSTPIATANVQTTLNHVNTTNYTSTSYVTISSTQPIAFSTIKSNHQSKFALQLEITILIVIGITILAVLLYFIFCRQIPNVHRKPKKRPIYCPMISKPHLALNEI